MRHRFPQVSDILKQLRDIHCGDSTCDYCSENHDPVKQLNKYFNYPDFRTTSDGRPLQRDIVQEGMNEKPLLGILPTGGGKSLCFQIPALVRYQRRGLLTVVISPLQALMKDQVDNLRQKTGTMAVAAVYGMLTPPERGAVLEQVRLGDIALLYISPEQLRNKSVINALSHREIGCWVFDEAHCLSKWGHDFRPDYLYCGRFIRESTAKNNLSIPPVACYTATAKADVIEDICQHFQTQLNQPLQLFLGGVERSNLLYEVHPTSNAAKHGRVAELIEERLTSDGSCVVYCATQKHTEELCEFLIRKDLSVSHFHGGLEAPLKKDILEKFIAGDIQIICATNAFGMGVDKENVRLVIHADIPGSLENYLQEAGRAGRDEQPAECILLFDEQDIETQFKLGALSEVRQNDIQQLLRGIRFLEKKQGEDIIVTTGELLRSDAVDTSFDMDDKSADTKVKTAVAWLERSGFLERNENSNQVFQGQALFSSLEEASEQLDRLSLTPFRRKQWDIILQALINTKPDEGIRADDLAEAIGTQIKDPKVRSQLKTADIIKILNQMADVGLVSNGLLMTAFLRPKGKNNARLTCQRLCQLEKAMLSKLREAHPDDHDDTPYPLNIRELNQAMLDEDLSFSNPALLRNLLKSLSEDGRGLAGSRGSIKLNYISKDHYKVTLCRPWSKIQTIMEKRHGLSQRILETLYQAIPTAEQSSQTEVLVEFSLESLRDSIRQDMTLDVSKDKEMAAIERGILFLHEQKAIILQQGLAVFRSAMTLRLNNEASSRRYNKGDYDPLFRHYKAKITQIHVMNEYVRLGLQKMTSALRMVRDYFEQDNAGFLNQYFRGRKSILKLATSQKSLKNIVDSLANPHQQAIVQAPVDKNMLVLAGPGSGKTKIVVHRCAYLLRIQRVRPYSILVLCYNHSAAITLRKRLQKLLGKEARTVTVQTFHGLAMRLTGISFHAKQQKQSAEEFNFDDLIPKATALLRGEINLPGFEGDQIREKLLAGFQHVLVDEYQDIDQQQYEMISAITGRSLQEGEEKLSILAVGDDDQSIYGFRAANIQYIRQFEQDYQAQRHHLVQNYRSTKHIIHAANHLIQSNRDRMKTRHDITINEGRLTQPAGGKLESSDPVSKGQVQIIQCDDIKQQTSGCVAELERLKRIMPGIQWSDCAILARNGISKQELTHIRSALEDRGIPFSLPLENNQNLPLFRIREFQQLLNALDQHKSELANTGQIWEWFTALQLPKSPWKSKILTLLEHWEQETAASETPVSAFTAYVVDYLRESRREQRLGEGIFLGTVHSAKGMEFKVVILLDGSWQLRKPQEQEEERRLFYVGMTRAMDLLVIFRRNDCSNPHIHDLTEGVEDALCVRTTQNHGNYPLKQYQILGLQDLYLSYAGNFHKNHRIHTILRQLNVGDQLILQQDAKGHKLIYQDQALAALSAKRSQVLSAAKIPDKQTAYILGLVTWCSEDSGEEYQDRHQSACWEVPLVEIRSDFDNYLSRN
ncbi:ATP-dependent DNA helicase RecQ [Endozoicomonas sp. NE43]